jgi:hypothetical protein
MRRLVEVYEPPWSERGRRKPIPERLYGPSMEDLIAFISAKYLIPRDWLRRIIYDIFRYIDGEVARHNELFYVFGFGSFKVAHGKSGAPRTDGRRLVSIGFNRTQHKRLFTYEDDPEDVTDEELDDIMQNQPELVQRALRNRNNDR